MANCPYQPWNTHTANTGLGTDKLLCTSFSVQHISSTEVDPHTKKDVRHISLLPEIDPGQWMAKNDSHGLISSGNKIRMYGIRAFSSCKPKERKDAPSALLYPVHVPCGNLQSAETTWLKLSGPKQRTEKLYATIVSILMSPALNYAWFVGSTG